MNLDNMVYGRLPPQAKNLEVAMLGAIMLEKEAFNLVADILREDCFYLEAHKIIFRTMKSMQAQSMPIDCELLVIQLQKNGELEAVGGPYNIVKMTNAVVSSANIEEHARIVLQKYIQRELIRISGEIIGEAYEDSCDALEIFDKAEASLFDISSKYFNPDYKDLFDGMPAFIERMEFLRNQGHCITGVPSGFEVLDSVTHGFQPTDLIIIAARPSVGKTAFALNLARNAAISKIRKTAIGLFSLEMGMQQLLQRMVSMDSNIIMDRLSDGKVHDMKVLYKSADSIAKMKIYVDDTAGLSILQLRAKARRMVSKQKVGMIIVDYLQLMEGDEKSNVNREQTISAISRGLKKLAKELKIPVIALSQLSRSVESRTVKEPMLSDLRESGAIEQDADVVMFLYRPEDESLKNRAMVKIAKHRNGKLERLSFRLDNDIQTWTEIGFLESKPWDKKKDKGINTENLGYSTSSHTTSSHTGEKSETGTDLPF